jgi:hypothetical protein
VLFGIWLLRSGSLRVRVRLHPLRHLRLRLGGLGLRRLRLGLRLAEKLDRPAACRAESFEEFVLGGFHHRPRPSLKKLEDCCFVFFPVHT